uniref:Secreted protein n=1 Tax=Oryza brachyantha TaxID=4533 RepID=J3M3F8_ORYBR
MVQSLLSLLSAAGSAACVDCHLTLKSASVSAPSADWRSSSRMVSSANSAGFSLSGMGSPNSEKKGLRPDGVPA